MSPQSEGNFPDVLAVCSEGLSPSRLLIHVVSLGTNDPGSSMVFLYRFLIMGRFGGCLFSQKNSMI